MPIEGNTHFINLVKAYSPYLAYPLWAVKLVWRKRSNAFFGARLRLRTFFIRENYNACNAEFLRIKIEEWVKLEEKKQIAPPTTEPEKKNEFSLETIIAAAVQIPGIKVERAPFLRERFKEVDTETLIKIVELGPIEAGCEQRLLEKKANALIDERTFTSTGASFLAGLPGGLAMAATIPADIIQYYAIALRMAQELAYLYGEKDLWTGEQIDDERVRNQLILYCGVMFGASGAAAALRVMASALSKHVAKTLAQKALTKTFYYPIVKSIAKAFTVKMTKEVFAKGVGKAIPVIGGLLSGGLTFFTMRPMGQALAKSLEEAHFHYTEEEI